MGVCVFITLHALYCFELNSCITDDFKHWLMQYNVNV